jgi:hypothetical protein
MATRPFLRSTRVDVSARKTYDVIDEPVGPEYDALLDSALTQCSTLVLTMRHDGEEPRARAVVDELGPHRLQDGAQGPVLRYRLSRETVAILKRSARGLYAWRHPALPENLCLLRADGTPWLVSISAERLGYLELTPFEKLLLGRAAPGLAAVLAHQAARDAILAYFERRYETHVEALTAEVERFARTVVEEGREGLVDAMADWIESDDPARVSAALDVIGAVGLTELRGEVAALSRAVIADTAPAPRVYRSNLVLRERWKARRSRQVQRVLDQLPPPASP